MLKIIFIVLGFTFLQFNTCYAAAVRDTDAVSQLGAAGAQPPATAEIPVPSAPARVGRDLTPDFKSNWETIDRKLGEKETTGLRKYKVLLVRGFMTGGYVEPFDILGRKIWIGRYFSDQEKVLKELGIDFSMVDIDSVMPPEHNAAKVAADIRGSEKPVIIISHSDGGMYALQALVENPDLRAKVRGFVALQAPFRGSPIADYIRSSRVLSAAMSKVLGHFGGTIDSLNSLTQGERSGFQGNNQADIEAVISSVSIISLATFKPDEPNKLDTLLEITRNLMLRRGMENDGLVPTESAILPGTDFVKLSGLDHIAPVMNEDMLLKFDRARLTKTLLLLLLNK